MSFDALDESLAQLEAKLSALQGRRRPAVPTSPAPAAEAAPAAPQPTERAHVAAPSLALPTETATHAGAPHAPWSVRPAEPSAPAPVAAPAVPAPAPHAAEAPGAVVREIGRLRSDVSGEMNRRFEELGREISSLRSSVASDRSSEMIQAEFGRVYDGLEAVATALDKRSGSQDTRRELDALKRTVDTLAHEETLHAVGRGQDELARRLAKHQSSVDPEIATIRGQLDDLVRKIEVAGDPAAMQAVERRLTAIGAALDDVRQIAGEGPDLRAIEARLEDIARVVVAASQAVPELDTAPFERIEARVASHQRRIDEREKRREAADAEMMAHLDRRLDAVVHAQNASTNAADEMGQGIAARFDSFAGTVRETADVTADRVGTEMTPRFEQVVTHVDGVGAKVEDFDRKLDGWGQRLEAEIGRPREPEINMFKALASRLDAVSDRLAEMPDAGTDDQNWTALEARLTAVLHKLDHIPTDTAAAASMDEMRTQIGTIAWKMEQPDDTPELMAKRLDALAERIDAVAAEAKVGDDTIARIGESVTGSIETSLDEKLSTRLGELTEVLHRTTAPLAEIGPRMDALEESMGDAQVTLVETARSAAEEVVRTMLESQEAMAPAELEAVTALDDDLKRLEALTVTNDERNNKTFDAVHETLLKIVDRLDTLDKMVAKATEGPDPAVVAATQAALVQTQAASNPSLMDRLRGRAPAAADAPAAPVAAPVEAAPANDDAIFAGLHPDQPLEPGSGEPRLDPPGIDAMTGDPITGFAAEPTVEGIVERVRAEGEPVDPAEDFMAVARRKAKMVSEEAEFTGSLDEPAGKTKGRKKKAKEKLAGDAEPKAKAKDKKSKGLSRPILLAAAAVLVAALAVPMIGNTLNGISPDPVAPVETALVAPELPEETVEAEPFGEEIALEATVADDAAEAVEVADAEVGTVEPIVAGATDTIETQSVDPFASEEATEVEGESPVVAGASTPSFTPVTGPVDGLEFTAADGPEALVAAAGTGDAKALFEVAGRVGPNDADRAFALYKAAAERGLAPAQYRLGQAYEKGRGTTLDYDQARRWYEIAADAGNTSAMHNLAVLHAMNGGNPEEAGRWFTEAASYGVKDSQYNLGILHAQGSGVAEDLTESYKWFDAAAKAGDADAGSKRDEVAGALDPAQLEEARAKAVAFRARTPAVDANRVNVPSEWRARPLAAADMKKAVRNVQAILNKNGFDAGVPDGVMGNRTRGAIRKFQESVGLPATGEIDDALVKALLARNT